MPKENYSYQILASNKLIKWGIASEHSLVQQSPDSKLSRLCNTLLSRCENPI